MEETLSALTDLVRSGKVRAIGASKQPAAGIVEAHWISERNGFERFRCEQPQYSTLNRGIESDVLPVAHRYGGHRRVGPAGPGPAHRPRTQRPARDPDPPGPLLRTPQRRAASTPWKREIHEIVI